MHRATQAVLSLYPQIYFACHTRHVTDAANNITLSAHQASILDHLDEREPTDLSTLARHMGVTASTMSLAVERLVRQNYILRTRDSGDQRRLRLLLTPDGERLRARKSVLDPRRVDALWDHLSTEERDRAVEGLRLLAEASRKAMSAQQNSNPFLREKGTA